MTCLCGDDDPDGCMNYNAGYPWCPEHDEHHRPPIHKSDLTVIPTPDLTCLLAVATLYLESFAQDELMTLPERLRLQEVEDVLKRHGRRY